MPHEDPASKQITVAICSYNRHDPLRKLLRALEGQTLARHLFAILVIDNSDDEGAREQFAKEFAGTRGLDVLFSTPPGLSRARNMAVDVCKSKYIAFIDDDAMPSPNWLGSLLTAFEKTEAGIIAGPIKPIWPKRKPDWLPSKYIACLTILDLGFADRWMTESEFAYGANMAFAVEGLRKVGGFNTVLGRSGSNTLLSEEEIEVQIAIRTQGYRAYYSAKAEVSHIVHSNRLTRNYFRARMAWQAVSSLIRSPPLKHGHWSRMEIDRAAKRLGIADLISKLITHQDAETFSAQLDLIYHLFALFLESKDVDDVTFEGPFHPKVSTRVPDSSDKISQDAYKPSAAISRKTEHIFVEGRPSHFFLYNLYSQVPRSQILIFEQDMRRNFDQSLAYLKRSLLPTVQSITFITVEPLIYGPSNWAFKQLMQDLDVPCFGILHRLPENPQQANALHEISVSFRALIVLAEELIGTLREEVGISGVLYLPLHPSAHTYLLRDPQKMRRRIGVLPEQVVFALIGELRRGKGLELFLNALDYLPAAAREQMFFLVAGRPNRVDDNTLPDLLKKKNAHFHLDLRKSEDPLKYNVLSDREIGEYFNVSEIGLLLYQYEQRKCMSGVVANYVWNRKRVIATFDSVVGRLVERYHLGITLTEETPQALAKAMVEALHRYRDGWVPSKAYEAYRAQVDPESVVASIKNIVTQQGLDWYSKWVSYGTDQKSAK